MRFLASAVLLAAVGAFSPAAADISDEILAKAIERYQAGDVQPALGGINAALRGRLSGSQLAKAYYYRGLANRKMGQPGQAITDLTRALEYSGLTDTERSDAKENLHVAYQEAGISENEKVVVARVADEELPPRKAPEPEKSFTTTVTAPVTGSVEAPKPPAAPAPSISSAPKAESAAWKTSTGPDPTPKLPPHPPQRSITWTSQQVALAPLPPIPQPTKTSEPKATSKPTAAAPAAATRPSPPAPALAPFVTQVSATPMQAVVTPPPPIPTEFRLLVGEAHSRNEAFALAIRLTSQRGAQLGPRRPQIAETKFADTAVYRLRLGPFTNQDQALALCRSLRDSGYECVSE